MDSISTFLKENYDLIVLFLSVPGVVIAFMSLVHEVRKKKGKKK